MLPGRISYLVQPRVSLDQMLELIAAWIKVGGQTLDKPTHFQEREGKF